MYDRSAPGYSDKKVRLSAIVAVEEGSKLFIYAAQDGPRIATVLLNVGDMVVFRGDCWHAGAKYRCPNRRLHGASMFMFTTCLTLGRVVTHTINTLLLPLV